MIYAGFIMFIISTFVDNIYYIQNTFSKVDKICLHIITKNIKKSKIIVNNSYLSHRIINSFLWILKYKIMILKSVLIAQRDPQLGITKLVLILYFNIR